MSRPRVAVLYGGRSGEHAISCLSARSILSVIDTDAYDVLPVGIRKDGRWVLPEGAPWEDTAGLPEVGDGETVVLAPDPTIGGLLRQGAGASSEVIPVDVVFPVLHGPMGEDGTIQGLLDLAGLPYVGSGVLASAAGMDKQYTKVMLSHAGVAVAPDLVVGRGDEVSPEDRERLGLPVFVKPARAGSSVGISRVADWSQLDEALAVALAVDSKVIIESEMVGREVECGVLESRIPGGGVEASVPAEIRLVGDRTWYDFEAKYLDNVTEFDVPARLDGETTTRLRDTARRAFVAMGCSGLARVDFFVRGDGSLVVNEVNTMPGFTEISMFPRMWAETGLPYPDLVRRLLEHTLEKAHS